MENGILSKHLESFSTTPPTYLKAVCPDINMDYIELVYTQKGDDNNSPTREERISIGNGDIDTTLDVTGSPLEVDLCGNETFTNINSDTVQHCLDKETEHFPVDIKLARSYLNQHMKTNRSGNIPVFVVCDGENSKKTVLIGIHRTNRFLFTCLLNVVGLYPKDHEKISLEAMRKSHLSLAGTRDLKINYLVHFKYYIHGSCIRNVKNIHDAAHFGSICMEISCDEQCGLELPRNLKQMEKKLILQIVVGHKLSSVYFLWEDICLLQNYVKILSKIDETNNGETKLSASPIPLTQILSSVKDLVSSMTLLRRQTKSLFDLKNIRTENILDKLWNILKYCENLSVLRNAFHHFFEELAASGSNMKLSEVNISNISNIVNGILDGKLAVPTVSYHQALAFLFEIGSEKLKNDYRAIIKQFYVISDSAISDSAISVKWKQLNNRFSLGNTKEEKTSIVIHNMSKLSYLGKLHVAVEMIYLVKDQVFIRQETFDDVCKCIYMNYVEKDVPNTSSGVPMDHLYEFEVHIDSFNEDVIKIETPISWNMQMKSTVKKSEITTVYHLSKYPIIPTTIYDRYDFAEGIEEDKMTYYVYKFEGHKDLIQ